MIHIGIELDPKTGKLGVKSNAASTKQTVAIMLEAAKVLVANIKESDDRIIPARSLPPLMEGR